MPDLFYYFSGIIMFYPVAIILIFIVFESGIFNYYFRHRKNLKANVY